MIAIITINTAICRRQRHDLLVREAGAAQHVDLGVLYISLCIHIYVSCVYIYIYTYIYIVISTLTLSFSIACNDAAMLFKQS